MSVRRRVAHLAGAVLGDERIGRLAARDAAVQVARHGAAQRRLYDDQHFGGSPDRHPISVRMKRCGNQESVDYVGNELTLEP